MSEFCKEVTENTDCTNCKYALWDYETYYGTTRREWFVTGCEMRLDEPDDCKEKEGK